MSIKSNRSCWWCNQKLMKNAGKILHRKVRTRDGYEVWVHVACEDAAAASQKVLTADVDHYPTKPPAQ